MSVQWIAFTYQHMPRQHVLPAQLLGDIRGRNRYQRSLLPRCTLTILVIVLSCASSSAQSQPPSSSLSHSFPDPHRPLISLTSPSPSLHTMAADNFQVRQASDSVIPILVGLLSGVLVVAAAAWRLKWTGLAFAARVGLLTAFFVVVHVGYTTQLLKAHVFEGEERHVTVAVPIPELEAIAASTAFNTEKEDASNASSTDQSIADARLASTETRTEHENLRTQSQRDVVQLDDSDESYVNSYFDSPPKPSSELLTTYAHMPADDNMESQLRAAFPATGNEPGPMPRSACQRDADIFQRYLHRHQHPSDCSTAQLIVKRSVDEHGYFAGMSVGVDYFHHALIARRVFVDLSSVDQLKEFCPTGDCRCVYKPSTSCNEAHFQESEVCYERRCFQSARVISFDKIQRSPQLPCSMAPDDAQAWCDVASDQPTNLNQIGNQLDLPHYGHQFFRRELTRFLFRPNAALLEYTLGLMKQHGLSRDTISVHIHRSNDRSSGSVQYPTIAYAHVLRRMVEISGAVTIFISSDDERAYVDLPRFLSGEFRGRNGSPPLKFVRLPRETGTETQLQGKSGMMLAAQMLLFGLSQGYLGTRNSQEGSMAQEMIELDCNRHKTFFDMNADLWFDGSYHNPRLKDKHAGREWMCALTPVEESYIYHFHGAPNMVQKPPVR